MALLTEGSSGGAQDPIRRIIPYSYTFADTPRNRWRDTVFTLTNITPNRSITIGDISSLFSDPFTLISDHVSGVTLTHGVSATFTIRFKPTSIGIQTITILIPTTDLGVLSFKATLSATGLAAYGLRRRQMVSMGED
jgi:hypothetical protein